MAGKIINVPLDVEARNELTMCAYRKWTEALDNLKRSKEMIFDRKVDGDRLSFTHSQRSCIENAEKDIAKWKAILDQIKIYAPILAKE